MSHYEIIFMVHPDNSEKITSIVDYYTNIVKKIGTINRLEDWGRRQLSYPIKKQHKAHYILMNIQIPNDKVIEIQEDLHFNKAVMRSMVIKTKAPVTEPSPMIKEKSSKLEKPTTAIN